MTNPESPDYAALIKKSSAQRDAPHMCGIDALLDTMKEMEFALRVLLKERDELQIMFDAETELVKEMQSCAITQHNKLVEQEEQGRCKSLMKERDELESENRAILEGAQQDKAIISSLQSKLEQYDKALEIIESVNGLSGIEATADDLRDIARSELERIRKL